MMLSGRIFMYSLLMASALISVTKAQQTIAALPGNWTVAGNAVWRHGCDFPIVKNSVGMMDLGTSQTPNSCGPNCWNITACTHFVYFNSTCYSRRMPPDSQPVEITDPKLTNKYICGYIPSRLNVTTSPANSSLTLHPTYVTMLNSVVQLVQSLNRSGVSRSKNLVNGQSAVDKMKCITNQPSINQNMSAIFKLCEYEYAYFNFSRNLPFFQKQFIVELCASNITAPVVTQRKKLLMGFMRDGIVRNSSLTQMEKARTTRYLEGCLVRHMPVPPVLIFNQTIYGDPALNKLLVESFLYGWINGYNVLLAEPNNQFRGQNYVNRYYQGTKRSMCLTEALLRNVNEVLIFAAATCSRCEETQGRRVFNNNYWPLNMLGALIP